MSEPRWNNKDLGNLTPPSFLPDASSRETVLSRSISQKKLGTTPLQNQVDGLVSDFVDQATDWKSIAAMTAGGLAYRWGKISVMGTNWARQVAPLQKPLAIAFGLSSEVTAFEFTNRSLITITERAGLKPAPTTQLWNWSGPGGWKEGLLNSFITFGTLKGFGQLSQGQNLVLQHGFQDLGIVAGHQLVSLTGLGPKPEGSLAEQMLHAEATNLQMGAGMALGHAFTGGRVLAWERALSLSSSSHNTSRLSSEKYFSLFYQIPLPALEKGPFLLKEADSLQILSDCTNTKEKKGFFRDLLSGWPSPKAKIKPAKDDKQKLSDEQIKTLARTIGTLLKDSSHLPPMSLEKWPHLKGDLDQMMNQAPLFRAAFLQEGAPFVTRIQEILEGVCPNTNIAILFFRELLFGNKIPDYQWPLSLSTLTEQQIENIFLWPILRRFAVERNFLLSQKYNSLVTTFPVRTLLEEAILTLGSVSLESSWGPACDVTAFVGRNADYYPMITQEIFPLLENDKGPLKIHVAGDSLAITGPEILGRWNQSRFGEIEIISSDVFEREVYYLTQGNQTAILDKKGQLLLLKKGNRIFSKMDPPPRNEIRELKKLFQSFDLRSDQDILSVGDARLQRVRWVHPRAEEISKENPARLRLATADILDPRSLQSAAQGKSDLVLLFNVINEKRFSRSKRKKALASLGKSLEEGGFLLVGFAGHHNDEGRKTPSTLNIFQMRGHQLIRVRINDTSFLSDPSTDFDQIPL